MMKEKAFNLLSFIMFILIIILSINVFNYNFYFEFDKNKIGNLYTYTFNINNLFKNILNNQLVNSEIKYYKTENKYYSNDYKLYSLNPGIVIFSNDNRILISQNNKYYLEYLGNFFSYVLKGDYVEKNIVIAEAYDYFYINIYNENRVISYEEYLKYTI